MDRHFFIAVLESWDAKMDVKKFQSEKKTEGTHYSIIRLEQSSDVCQSYDIFRQTLYFKIRYTSESIYVRSSLIHAFSYTSVSERK